MDEQIGQNLRFYSRQLTAQLKEKEQELSDLKRRFSKLQGRFDELDHAFKENLQLHQQQMISINDLHLSKKELRKVERDSWGQFRKMEEQLTQVTNEKEAAKTDLAYWKQAVIDQKIFYEGKFEECLREWNLKMEADAIVHQKTLKETLTLAEKQIQELARRLKVNEEEGEVIRKKAIMLQGDVDVMRHRAQELACLFNDFPGINRSLQAIGSCIVRVLRSFSAPTDDHDNSMKKLHQELLQGIARPPLNPEENILDYENLRSQNLVLREVVKKLKKELTKVEKSELILPKPLVDGDTRKDRLEKEVIQLNTENKKLCNLIAEKDADLKKLRIVSEKNIERLEMSLELMKSKKDGVKTNLSKINIDSYDCKTTSKTVEAEKESIGNSESQEYREFDDNKSQAVYWGLREGRVKKFKKQGTRNMMRSLELNLETLNSERFRKNSVTLKDKQDVENNTGSYLNGGKNTDEKRSKGQLEPIESHLNSVQYKEYTIPLWKNYHLKIRHPIMQGSNEKMLRFRSVHSEKEYQRIPIDEIVFYFDCGNGDSVFPNSRMTNCAIQTILIPTVNVFTQTATSKYTLDGQASTGVKILNSERRAIERSLQGLEKTVSEAGSEALGLARSMIVNTSKFPPSEEFFDCIKYLSQCGAT